VRDARHDPTRAPQRLAHDLEPPLGRDRGHDDRRPRRGDELRPDQDRRAVPHGPRREVQSAPAHRGGARRERALRREAARGGALMDARRTAPAGASDTAPESALHAGAATSAESATSTESVRASGAGLRYLGARLVYWTPVFAALALFAQIAFLGLRPALSEARRLAAASDVLEARWARD